MSKTLTSLDKQSHVVAASESAGDFYGTAQHGVVPGRTHEGTIGANPNSTGGADMKPLRDPRAGRTNAGTAFGDAFSKDEYLYASGVALVQPYGDSLPDHGMKRCDYTDGVSVRDI